MRTSVVRSRITPALAVVLALAAAGCASPSASRYGGDEVGRPIETSRGTVVASRVVDVAGETTMAGPAAGAALGGAGMGWGFGSGWAGLIGAVVGAGIGYAAQQWANDRKGIEYIVQMEDGRTVTLVQNRGDAEAPLHSGTQVLVQVSGQYTRVIPAPQPTDRPPPAAATAGPEPGAAPAAPAGGGGWVDPDSRPATVAPPDQGPAPPTSKTAADRLAAPSVSADAGSWQAPPRRSP